MIEEILEMGFDRVELGYDLRMDLVPGVQAMVESGAVQIDTLHNFCPLPMGAINANPEIYTLSDPDPRVRNRAVEYTTRTIQFAAELGARAVVVHAGNVKMKRMSEQLLGLLHQERQFTPAYEKLKFKLQVTRDKKVKKQLAFLYQGLEQLLPVLEECNVRLGIENLPTWEAIPTEVELEALLKHFDSKYLGYWHDMGHAQIRENLGLINHERWLERLQNYIVGMHVHDVMLPARDHVMPPKGSIDFSHLKRFAEQDVYRVLEPAPMTPKEEIVLAHEFLHRTWATG